jgi:apolipoprotein N-acyltransferase
MGWFYRFFRNFVPPSFSVFDRGLMHDEEKTQRIFTVGKHKLAPNICFEISFPELLRQGTDKGATVHLCPANDAWFVRGAPGRGISTAEIALAQAHTKFRAIENRRSMVRCVNRGVSLVVDPKGETVSRIERIGPDGEPVTVGVAGTLVVRPPVSDLRTFYVRFGNVFPLACGLIMLVLCGLASKGRVLIG